VGSSIKLGRIFGVDVGVHWSWIFIFLIVTWSFATGVFDEFYPQWTDAQKWIGGGVVSIVFFLSVLAHELSHAVVSNRTGLPVKSITLFVFGGVANLSRDPDNAAQEFKIAVVGPLSSLLIGAVFAALWAAFYTRNDGLAGIFANLALINASLAVFNMLPGFPLDGGRVFRSLVWLKNKNRLRATKIASTAGEWIAYAIMAGGAVELIFGYFGGLWLLFIGFFLRNAASASYEQLLVETTLDGVFVRDVMQTEFDSVGPETTVEELVQEHVLRKNARCFAVIAAGDFAGLITLTDVRKLPRDQWPLTTVYRAMTPASRLYSVAPSETLTRVLQVMGMHDVNQLPVVYGRELVGMLARADVMRFVQLRQDLGGVRDGTAPTADGRVETADAVARES
jgi:Zn-dependent protease/CBS domain-containing protein